MTDILNDHGIEIIRRSGEEDPNLGGPHRIIRTKSYLNNAAGPIDIQNPLPCDGDSVYVKDIWVAQSDIGDFSGSVTDLFDNLHSVISDITSTNPKEVLIHFNRTIPLLAIGLGAFTGNFSNLKIIGLTTGHVETVLYDGSADDTKKTTQTLFVLSTGNNAIKLQFHTADTVTLSNLFIFKAIGTVSRIQGQKPNGDFVEFQSTATGNFKMSLEEFENAISVNNNTQMRTTSFDSSGNEGQSIIGVDYVSGKSGIDSATETLQSIEYEHHEIHSGSHFFICNFEVLGNGVAADFVITTPNTTEWAHMTFSINSTDGASIEVYEGITHDGDGVTSTPYNNNRNSVNTSSLGVQRDPTITDLGTRIFGNSSGERGQVGFINRSSEIMLKQNTEYLFRITSLAISNTVSYCGEWYEHTNKN